jgi:hypothetical protein
MRRLFAPVVFLAAAFAVMPTLALADDIVLNEDNGIDGSIATTPNDTTFDLGVDVTGVAHTPAAARGYLSSLAPQTQSAIMGACETFMAHPSTAQSPETYAFCSNAVHG